MNDLGYFNAKEIQAKALSRIIGGQSVIGIAPEGAGKTTTYVLGMLMRLKYTRDEAPKVLVLAPNEERVNEIVNRFLTVSGNRDLYVMGLKASGSTEEEIEALVRGVDIVVATPNRARAIYLKLGLNLNRIQTFIIDDADEIIKNGMQTPVKELAQSCGKVQYLAFSTVEHEKLHAMVDDFMPLATLIEVDEFEETPVETHELMLYQVPNFSTKINLLNLLMRDDEVFDKVVVFVNSRFTAQKLSQNLNVKKGELTVLHPFFHDDDGIDDIEEFKENPAYRILIIAHEGTAHIDLSGIPFIFQFEIPENKDIFISYSEKKEEDAAIMITFATDIELPELKKIEQSLGKKIPVTPLPENLSIYNASTSTKGKAKVDETRGGAFQQKKESNNKSYNYGGGVKAKMTMKKKKG